MDPVDHRAAAEARRPEEPVGEIAQRPAEDRGEEQRRAPAGGPGQKDGDHGDDGDGYEHDGDRVSRADAEAGPRVPDQRDCDDAVSVAGAGRDHQGLAQLVGGQHEQRDRARRPARAR